VKRTDSGSYQSEWARGTRTHNLRITNLAFGIDRRDSPSLGRFSNCQRESGGHYYFKLINVRRVFIVSCA
jgi:hypothetical protein